MDELDMDAEGLPDEPVRDPWTYAPDPVTLIGLAALAAFNAAVLVWVGAAALEDARR